MNTSQVAKWRLVLLCVAIAMLPLMLVWHLATLQVIPNSGKDYRFLQSEGEARTLRSLSIPAYRGVVTDRHGELLAVSTPLVSIEANPQNLKQKDIPKLASLLGLSQKTLAARVKKYKNKQFMYVARHLPPQSVDTKQLRRIGGISVKEEYRRYYPAGEVAAHIVGFTDIEDQGQEGIELAYNEWLAGKPGKKSVIKDLRGNVVKENGMVTAPSTGNALRLTIDLRLQYLAHKELKKAVLGQGAKGGTLVMLDVETGEVLAMANQPTYNPNDRKRLNPAHMRNRALTDVFEPGSTMKPLTVMAALETGRFKANHTINTSPGYVRVGKKTLLDPRDYGVMNLTTMIKKSSQVGITKLALELDGTYLRDFFYRAGLGQDTGLAFPGESPGVLPARRKWRPIEQANLSFGYGLNVNAVQLAQSYAMIAGKGKIKPVSLVVKNNEAQQEALAEEQIVSPKIAYDMTQMLKEVTLTGGTATRAQINAYPVAGKSGTAHKVENGVYADNKYKAFFAGFAPADNPKIVAVVVIDEPSNGKYFGGESAAPVFAASVQRALEVLQVAPADTQEYSLSVPDVLRPTPEKIVGAL